MTEIISVDYLRKKITVLEDYNTDLKRQNAELQTIIDELLIEKDRNCGARIKAIFEDSIFGFIRTDEKGRVTVFNKRAPLLLGTSGENLMGFSCHDFPDHNLKNAMQKALEGEKSHFEGEHLTLSGNMLAISNACFIPDIDGKGNIWGIMGIFEDISERVHMEKERDSLICELRSALTKLKIMGGLIPVCASCKKIRDDKGFWTQVEEYILNDFDSEFSHGVCPDCMKKLYPGPGHR